MDVSDCRQQIRSTLAREDRIVRALLGVRSLIKGGFYKTRIKCGKKGCKCEEGELHAVWMFYCSEKGKTKIRTMSQHDVYAYNQYADNYKKYRQGRAELVKLYKEQLRLIDSLEKGLRKEKRNIEQKLLRKRR